MVITHLWRYPVKSLAGEPMTCAQVDRGGIPFDRRYALIDGDSARKGKALTARQIAALLSYQATVVNEKVSVRAPDGTAFAPNAALAAHLESSLKRSMWLDEAQPGGETFHDAHDILVINAASVRALEAEWGKPLNPLRFRPNIMIAGEDAESYVELNWIGRSFRAGEAVFDVKAPDIRCVLTTIDPQTLETDPSFLKLIVQRHEACFGVYCQVKKPGRIALGDEWLPADNVNEASDL